MSFGGFQINAVCKHTVYARNIYSAERGKIQIGQILTVIEHTIHILNFGSIKAADIKLCQ